MCALTSIGRLLIFSEAVTTQASPGGRFGISYRAAAVQMPQSPVAQMMAAIMFGIWASRSSTCQGVENARMPLKLVVEGGEVTRRVEGQLSWVDLDVALISFRRARRSYESGPKDRDR
jgi:hypothetical protein